MATGMRYIRQSDKYKYVGLYIDNKTGRDVWLGKRWNSGKYFDNERSAAIYVDKQLLEKGKNPVNILVRK